MKLNEVKFLPATNAVADAYTKATGIPFVGEMMAAAAGIEETSEDDNDNDKEEKNPEE